MINQEIEDGVNHCKKNTYYEAMCYCKNKMALRNVFAIDGEATWFLRTTSESAPSHT